MAEGRMLKRNISESRRLSELKTDAARLLWTWIIPFLDSEGRFYASPEMIKGKIVPRIRTFTVKNIPAYLADMARVGLITLYAVDGEKLMQYRKFEAFQNIVKSREAAPLPGPESRGSVPTPSGSDHDSSRSDHDQIVTKSRLPVPNLREVNLREANKALPTEERPVDNPQPQKPALPKPEEKKPPAIPKAFGNGNGRYESQDKFVQDLQATFREICEAYPDLKTHRQVQLFVEQNLKGGHRGAIIHALKSLLNPPEGVKNIGGWLSSVYRVEHAKYNARDHEAEAEQWKKPLSPEASEILKQLGLSGFGGGMANGR